MATTETESKAEKNNAGKGGAVPKRGKSVESSMGARALKLEKGNEFEGRYLGHKLMPPHVGGKNQPFFSFHFRLPPDKQHPDGERVCLASAMLNSKMNQVPKGTYCWITCKGEVEVGKGTSMDYEVQMEAGAEPLDEDSHPVLDPREAWEALQG